MSEQHVPTEPGGYILDYTYCGSENCQNKCGRKMSDSISKAIDEMGATRISYGDFCKEGE